MFNFSQLQFTVCCIDNLFGDNGIIQVTRCCLTQKAAASEKEGNLWWNRLSQLQYLLAFEYWTLEPYEFKLNFCVGDINGVQ